MSEKTDKSGTGETKPGPGTREERQAVVKPQSDQVRPSRKLVTDQKAPLPQSDLARPTPVVQEPEAGTRAVPQRDAPKSEGEKGSGGE